MQINDTRRGARVTARDPRAHNSVSSLDESPNARIQVSLADVQHAAGGAVVGHIWIAAGNTGAAFPEMGWSDHPVVLLSTWIPSLRTLATLGQAAECHFMDGPYHFSVSATTDGEWRISCFEGREGPSVANAVAEWPTKPDEFLGSALAAAHAILGYCDTRHWWNADTDRLRDAIAFADPDRAS